MQASKARRLTALWVSLAALIIPVYMFSQSTPGSTAGIFWICASTLCLATCLATGRFVSIATEKIREATQKDGSFILDAVEEFIGRDDAAVDSATRMARSIGFHLQAGDEIHDDIRSEAIRFAELKLNREAPVSYGPL
jgi:hypothetical protein